MAVNKVIYGGETLVDLTSDTVTSETLAAGATAHNSSGETVVGTVTMLTVDEISQQAAQMVSKESLGLNNVDNTSDLEKPVSTAQQAALAEKAPAGFADGGHDTVIAQGASGIWTYRKWASGIAECWTRVDLVDVFASDTLINKSIALPFALVEYKRVLCSPALYNTRFLTVPPHDNTSSLTEVDVTAQYSAAFGSNCIVNVYVMGR